MSTPTPPNSPSGSSSKSSKGLGNTKPNPEKRKQVSPAKKWCLTWNNYPLNWKSYFDSSKVPEIEAFVLGFEIGDSGTPHIQGTIKFKKKLRPKGLFDTNEIHWEACKDWIASIAYCRKDGNTVEYGVPRAERELECLKETDMYPWQRECVQYCRSIPDNRTIKWYYERKGGVGKSALCRYLCIHLHALICSGKASDMKYLIVKYKEKYGVYPEVIIMDIPRSCLDYVSYTGIEEIKNGVFCSTKYECDMVVMNSPHVICFANEKPEIEKMSKDRWDIIKLK